MEAPHRRYNKILDAINDCGTKFEQLLISFIGEPAMNVIKPFRFLLLRIFSVCLYYIVGVIYYNNVEHWNIANCVYFITVSVSTVGYGQFHATNDGSRVFTAFYILVGLAFVLTAVDEFARHFVVEFQRTVVRSLYPQSTKLDQAMKMTMTSSATLFILMLIGIIFFVNNEKWNSAESFYFTITTMTTVGYGDLIITHESTRIFIIFFICVCLTNYATVIQNVREMQIVTILIRAGNGGSEFMHISDEAVRGGASDSTALVGGASGVNSRVNSPELSYSHVEMRRRSESNEDETFNPFVNSKRKMDVDRKENVDVAICLMQLILNNDIDESTGNNNAQDIQRNSVLLLNDLTALKEKYSKSGGKGSLRTTMTKEDIMDYVSKYSSLPTSFGAKKASKQSLAVADGDEEFKTEV